MAAHYKQLYIGAYDLKTIATHQSGHLVVASEFAMDCSAVLYDSAIDEALVLGTTRFFWSKSRPTKHQLGVSSLAGWVAEFVFSDPERSLDEVFDLIVWYDVAARPSDFEGLPADRRLWWPMVRKAHQILTSGKDFFESVTRHLMLNGRIDDNLVAQLAELYARKV